MKLQYEELVRLVQEYASMQGTLCRALKEKFENPPKRGNLSIGESYWEFEKHGLGFIFVLVPSEIIVDAHVCWSSFPEAIDAWRMVTYLESKKVAHIEFLGNTYDISNERAVDRLLRQLVETKFLCKASCENDNLYLLK